MPPRRRARPAPPDVDVLRTALAQGKVVRVGIIPSDQFPEGLTGRVRRIGSPAQDGEEYLFVEVSVGGAKDVLPFAPGDLTGSPPRKPTATDAGAGGNAAPPAGSAGPVALFAATASAPTSRTPPAVATPGARATTSNESGSAATTRMPAAEGSRTEHGGAAAAAEPAAGGPASSSRRAAGSAARGKRPPVTITLSTAGDETASWRVEAHIGARTAVRATPVSPSRVWEIVESLGEPKLTAVIQTLLDEHRRSTQARADVLAAELAALQSELSSYPAADR